MRLTTVVYTTLELRLARLSRRCLSFQPGRAISVPRFVDVMASFSQRKGIHPMQKLLQKEGIDDELRNSLWSVLHGVIYETYSNSSYKPMDLEIDALFTKYWLFYFKLPSDTKPVLFRCAETRPYLLF